MSNITTAYEDEFFRGDIEIKEGLAFFHVSVKQDINKSAVRLGREVFGEIKKAVNHLGYERLYAYTPKIHFARLLGPDYVHIQTIEAPDETLELIVWELEEDK